MAKISSLITNYKLLIIILIATSFLRLWKLDKVPISMFSDELDVGYQAYSIIKSGKDYMGNPWPLYFQSYADLRTPVYIYSAIPAVYLFGITPYGVRLPAAIFGILGVWAMYLLVKELLSYKVIKNENQSQITNHPVRKSYALSVAGGQSLALVSAAILALSPWHIQYSRAAFEVTELLFFLLMGLYFFFKSINVSHPEFISGSKMLNQVQHDAKAKWLLLSVLFLGITPWIYSTAKLFTPILILMLFLLWRKEILEFSKKKIITSILILVFFALPLVLTGAGSQRFSYISVFTDPTVDGEVASQRLIDAQVGGKDRNILEKITSRAIHNKYGFYISKVIGNFYETFSTQFLFIKGDLNLRHSPEGIGQFYKIEALALILGLFLFFFINKKDYKVKALMAFWIFFGALPSAITRDGGYHATRLILILPPLIFLISYGILQPEVIVNSKYKILFLTSYFLLLTSNFVIYQHIYWVHNPWYSERAWHAGYKELIASAKGLEDNYEKIIISNANDDPRIFLAAYYPYPPEIWQRGFQKDNVVGFGEMQHIDKFYFGQVGEEGTETLPEILGENTLYIAAQRELGTNLIMDPQKTPVGLRLVKAIAYPSGEQAFYFLEKSGQ